MQLLTVPNNPNTATIIYIYFLYSLKLNNVRWDIYFNHIVIKRKWKSLVDFLEDHLSVVVVCKRSTPLYQHLVIQPIFFNVHHNTMKVYVIIKINDIDGSCSIPYIQYHLKILMLIECVPPSLIRFPERQKLLNDLDLCICLIFRNIVQFSIKLVIFREKNTKLIAIDVIIVAGAILQSNRRIF